jgi:uncharacterized Zn finger protein (UPF0148 family)
VTEDLLTPPARACPCGTPIASYNRSGKCALCRARERYHANPEKYRQRAKDWRATHKQAVADDNRARYLADTEGFKARAKAWKEANPERRREIARDSRHREALAALEASRASIRTLPRIKALDDLARVRATQVMYGIQRVGM